MAKRVKGILFDLGDTLLDFGKVDISSLFEAGAKLAYGYLEQFKLPLPSFRRYHRQQLWAIRWSYLKSRFTRREFNALDILGWLSERMGYTLTREQTVELAWLWYQPLSQCATVEDGLREMLASLRDAGLRLGIVSNTFVPSEVLDRHLDRERLLEYLPVRVYSCDAGIRKPDPQVFRIALQRAGLEADETIFVGDSPQADAAGARRAGMISVLKDPDARCDDAGNVADHRIARITELTKIVAKYNGSA